MALQQNIANYFRMTCPFVPMIRVPGVTSFFTRLVRRRFIPPLQFLPLWRDKAQHPCKATMHKRGIQAADKYHLESSAGRLNRDRVGVRDIGDFLDTMEQYP